jgi:hypothetical protein
MSFKQTITHNLLNIPGWHTRRRILVIESDDWGSIRMPSKVVYDALLKRDLHVDKDPYCRYDNLATAEDLEALYDTLRSVKDKNGRSAVLTANAVMANPVFDKIKESGYKEYFYEPFTETLKRNPKHEGAFELWKQGIEDGLFHPQFHGREHLNVKKWLDALQSGEEATCLAFEHGTFGLTSDVSPSIKANYMGAFDSCLPADLVFYKQSIQDGLKLFEQLIGYPSESFIATTYTWSPKIEPFLADCGVKYLQGMVHQRVPLDEGNNFTYKKNNFTGYKSSSKLTYVTRNCYFEPSQSEIDWVGDCMNRIKIAFRLGKPAVVSAHRVNFIGNIEESNRTNNLKKFSTLLKMVVEKYPDVEFMSTDELGRLITSAR